MVAPRDARRSPVDDAASVTVHDVAREAGVSQSAVSRAFTPGSSLVADKRERILAAAAKLGYRPNPLARSLIRGRSGIVGVGVGNLANPFFVATLQLLSDRLDQNGLRLMLFPAQGEPSIQDVLHYRIDALVLLSVSLSSLLAGECRRAGVPIILYNRTTDQDDASCVVGYNAHGARAVAAHLLGGGHRRLAFLSGSPDASTNIEREAGFAGYLAEQGLPPPLRECGHFAFDAAMAATRRDRDETIACLADAYIRCAADLTGEFHIVGAALAGSPEKADVYDELLDQSVAMFVSVLRPFTAMSDDAATQLAIGLVGAGEGLSAAIVRGKLSEADGIAAFARIIRDSLAS